MSRKSPKTSAAAGIESPLALTSRVRSKKPGSLSSTSSKENCRKSSRFGVELLDEKQCFLSIFNILIDFQGPD
jgi:hypothetical protein